MSFRAFEPAIYVPAGDGNKRQVEVRAFTCQGFVDFMAEFRKADLPLPSLDGEKLGRFLDVATQSIAAVKGGGEIDMEEATQVVFDLIAGNMETIFKWLSGCPALIPVALSDTTNLDEMQIANLSLGDAIRTCRQVLKAIQEDGALREVGGFFGDALLAGAQQKAAAAIPAAA